MIPKTLKAYVVGAQRLPDPLNLNTKYQLLLQFSSGEGANGKIEVDISPEEYAQFSRNFPNGPFAVELKVLFDKQPIT